ncbi:hypothetical protein CCACVL1_24967 [Corchorus capsularis]|uniref:DUF7722 domain-containing protein n=1 Tax=Corchorus capsularis TaxID=210143 RepID=A0A1R3GML7_COCAP|nr:hypothetical protein CCACVL1_24967 [Corchorus capsularis]
MENSDRISNGGGAIMLEKSETTDQSKEDVKDEEKIDQVINKRISKVKENNNGKSCSFLMPLHYPIFTKEEYEKMPLWRLDQLFGEYGLKVMEGDLDYKRKFAMAAFLWPTTPPKLRHRTADAAAAFSFALFLVFRSLLLSPDPPPSFPYSEKLNPAQNRRKGKTSCPSGAVPPWQSRPSGEAPLWQSRPSGEAPPWLRAKVKKWQRSKGKSVKSGTVNSKNRTNSVSKSTMDDLRQYIVSNHCDREDARLTYLRQNQISHRIEMQIWLKELRTIGNGERQGSVCINLSPQRPRSIGQIQHGPSIEDCD